MYHNRKRRKRLGFGFCLELEKHVALVLDIHHHWCHSGGEYIEVNDDRVKRIIDSWRGVRVLLCIILLAGKIISRDIERTLTRFSKSSNARLQKAKLRAHSDYMWNTAVNEWAGTFRKDFDIMVEAKCKNLASIPFEEETR